MIALNLWGNIMTGSAGCVPERREGVTKGTRFFYSSTGRNAFYQRNTLGYPQTFKQFKYPTN